MTTARHFVGDVITMVTIVCLRTVVATGWSDQNRPFVNLTFESATTASAILKWITLNRSVDGTMTSSRLAVSRASSRGIYTRHHSAETFILVGADTDRNSKQETSSGWYQLDDLVPGTSYSAQLVAGTNDAREGFNSLRNYSNIVYFSTLQDDGVATVRANQFRMHPAEVAVVILILGVWVAAVVAFLHKWRRLRIVPPREPRFKHAPPKNLDAVQVVSRPNDSVIYNSYTRQLSSTMEARRSRLERMHTMPNIKLTGSPNESSRGRRHIAKSVLDTTAEEMVGGEADTASPRLASWGSRKLSACIKPFVKRKSDSRLVSAQQSGVDGYSRRRSMFVDAEFGLGSVRQLVIQSASKSIGGRRQSEQIIHVSGLSASTICEENVAMTSIDDDSSDIQQAASGTSWAEVEWRHRCNDLQEDDGNQPAYDIKPVFNESSADSACHLEDENGRATECRLLADELTPCHPTQQSETWQLQDRRTSDMPDANSNGVRVTDETDL